MAGGLFCIIYNISLFLLATEGMYEVVEMIDN